MTFTKEKIDEKKTVKGERVRLPDDHSHISTQTGFVMCIQCISYKMAVVCQTRHICLSDTSHVHVQCVSFWVVVVCVWGVTSLFCTGRLQGQGYRVGRGLRRCVLFIEHMQNPVSTTVYSRLYFVGR